MGLFDRIIKNVVKDTANAVIDNVVQQGIQNHVNQSSNTVNNDVIVPAMYQSFPKYPGSIYKKPVETNTNDYSRLTIVYNGTPNTEYINSLLRSNYIQGSSVRYDRDNTYVIVEDLGNTTKIAYHIKK